MVTRLAGYNERICALVIDYFVIYFPSLVLACSAIMSNNGLLVGVALCHALGVVFVQLAKLHMVGQTIGMKAVKIKIVKIDDGENGGFLTNVLMRILVPRLIALVPLIGQAFVIANFVFLFRLDRRSLCDVIAGTEVVNE